VKGLVKSLLDGRLLVGLGVGIIIATILLSAAPKKGLSPMEIEVRARAMGMVYEDEIRAIPGSSQEGE